MWRERIIEAKKALGISPKTMSERTMHIPERTIVRLLNGETSNPYVDTVLEVGASVGLSPQEIFSETNLVLGSKDLATLQADLDMVKAENDILVTENNILKDKVACLTAENDLLRMKLEHKEEIINLHNYYGKALKVLSADKGESTNV
jgi:plasmid maintenance system antidote protein VapI